MANDVTSVIEGTFNLDGAYTISVDGVSVDVNGTGVNAWYRIVFANSANTGAVDSPLSFSSHLDSLIGPDYSVRPPTSAGLFAIRRDAVGSGTIDFSDSLEGLFIAALLGYTTTVLNFSSGQTITAEYPPAYRLLLIGAGNDTDWQAEGVGTAVTETDDGAVYVLTGNRVKQRRSFTLEHHVRDAGLWIVAPFAGVFPNTPVLPDPAGSYVGKMVDQTEDLPTAAPPVPFTVLDFWATQRGRPMAAIIATFQPMLANPSTLRWDEAYLDKKTCDAGPFIKLRDARWNSVMSPGPWGFTLFEAGVTP